VESVDEFGDFELDEPAMSPVSSPVNEDAVVSEEIDVLDFEDIPALDAASPTGSPSRQDTNEVVEEIEDIESESGPLKPDPFAPIPMDGQVSIHPVSPTDSPLDDDSLFENMDISLDD
jgi:hypothetical protein